MTRMSRTLLTLSVVLALTIFAAPALAAETGTSGYYNTPPKPAPNSTTPSSNTAPSSGTGPSRESSKPRTTSSSPSHTSTTPPTVPSSSSPTSTSRSTLPFTGLDLRWVIGIGVLLLGAGLTLRVTQRRQRQDLGR
jgi:hypothetical protein